MNEMQPTAEVADRFPGIEEITAELSALREEILSFAEEFSNQIAEAPSSYSLSALNLLHYLALRRRDLHHLQQKLSALGLSSLDGDSHVLATVNAVLNLLHGLDGKPFEMSPGENILNLETAQRLLAGHAATLLGKAPDNRRVRIMVTMPSQAASDYQFVKSLLETGMNVMRINCAHDDAKAWLKMIRNLRRAEKSSGKSCRVLMDLAGPKLRTGAIEPSEYVLEIRPLVDHFGKTLATARVWLTAREAPFDSPAKTAAVLQFPAAWLKKIKKGEKINFTDAGGFERTLAIVSGTSRGCWAEIEENAFITPDTVFYHKNKSGQTALMTEAEASIKLQKGDKLTLTRDGQLGRNAAYDQKGKLSAPASIGCTIPEVFDDAQAGESIWFDDGKIGGVIEKIERKRVFVRITQARPKGEKLRADKGINLPASKLRLKALTEKDLEDLRFIVEHADIVAMSFVNRADDIEMLEKSMAAIGQNRPAVVLKIETREGFENLSELLLAAARARSLGVMIARGDLAIECGFERLAEAQEEILSVCRAAHVPVVWATQVLESLAKDGLPSRAEITDAAMGHRAECVMLNKGEHIVAAVEMLDDILCRMQSKPKQALPRPASKDTSG